MKSPDINETLREEGIDAVRARHDRAERFNSSTSTLPYDSRFRLKYFDEIMLSTRPNYLVKGIIPRIGLTIVWGPPKCGKSFWTFDLMMHVALGWKYRGRRVQQGPVVYFAPEGGHGFPSRKEAWCRRYLSDHHEPVPFCLLDVPIDLIADRDKLIQAIRAQMGEQTPAAVVIDTLNRALTGDENKSDDMAKFIRAADMIRTAFACAVIIVHHCGVQGSRPRGHSSLSGADDAQIAVEKDNDSNITCKVEHMKDGDPSAPIVSRLERVELDLDHDGELMTSCVIVAVDGLAGEKAKKLNAAAKLALKQLHELIAAAGEPAPASNHVPQNVRVCPAALWRETFYKARIDEKPDTKRKAFVRAVETLQEAHLIGIWSDKVWLARQPGQGRTNGKCPGERS
jgi:hypothetical protein